MSPSRTLARILRLVPFGVVAIAVSTPSHARDVVGALGVYQIDAKSVRAITLPAPYKSILGITVGEDSIVSVARKLGDSEVLPVHKDPSRRLCFAVQTGVGRTSVVVFEAGPLGGFSQITGFIAYSKRPPEFAHFRCRELGKPAARAAGLALVGMKRADLIARIGAPTATQSNSILYLFEVARDPETLIQGMLEARLVNGRVDALAVSETVSK